MRVGRGSEHFKRFWVVYNNPNCFVGDIWTRFNNEWLVTLHSGFGHVWKLAWRIVGIASTSGSVTKNFSGSPPVILHMVVVAASSRIFLDLQSVVFFRFWIFVFFSGLVSQVRQMRLLAVEVFLPRRAFRHILL